MKGLLYKDLICCRMHRFLTAFILLGWAGLAAVFVIFSGPDFYPPFIFSMGFMLLTMMEVLYCFLYDDQAKWNSYGFSLPYTRHQAVLEKYLLNFGLLIFALLVTLPFYAARTGWNAQDFLALSAWSGGALVYSAVQFPLTFWLGGQKASFLFCIICIFPTVQESIEKHTGVFLSAETVGFLLHWLWLVGLLLFTASYFLSQKIMKEKDII